MPEKAPDVFLVYPDNLPVIQLFMRVQTQWNISPMGQRMGLNYPGVAAAAAMSCMDINETIFDGLQIMEFHTLRLAGGK